MARPRRVPPELCADERLEECSFVAASLFYRVSTQADDQDRLPRATRSVRGASFPMRQAITDPRGSSSGCVGPNHRAASPLNVEEPLDLPSRRCAGSTFGLGNQRPPSSWSRRFASTRAAQNRLIARGDARSQSSSKSVRRGTSALRCGIGGCVQLADGRARPGDDAGLDRMSAWSQ